MVMTQSSSCCSRGRLWCSVADRSCSGCAWLHLVEQRRKEAGKRQWLHGVSNPLCQLHLYQVPYKNSYSSCCIWFLTILFLLREWFLWKIYFPGQFKKTPRFARVKARECCWITHCTTQDRFIVKTGLLACYFLINVFPFSASMLCTKVYLLSSWHMKKLPFSGKQRQAEQFLRNTITLTPPNPN